MKDTMGLSHRKKECHRNNARLYNPQKSLFEEEEEDKEDKEEEDKGRDEREPPQRCSTTKTAHVDTTYYYYECRLYLFIKYSDSAFFLIDWSHWSHSFLHFALKLLSYERKLWKGAVLKKRGGRCCSTF